MTGPGYEASHVLSDGRVIEYWEGGDPDGRGVVLHPGTPASRVLGRWGHEPAGRAGVRLVAVNRPGYGGSTVTTSDAPRTPPLSPPISVCRSTPYSGSRAAGRSPWPPRSPTRAPCVP